MTTRMASRAAPPVDRPLSRAAAIRKMDRMPPHAEGSTTVPPLEPARRISWTHVALFGGAVVLGLVSNRVVQGHLATLQALAATDPIAARSQLAIEFRVGGIGLFAVTALLGAAIIATARGAMRELRFPPTGMWSWGGARTVTGPGVRPVAFFAAFLGAVLILCSLGGAALSWEIGTRLLTCRAGVATPH